MRPGRLNPMLAHPTRESDDAMASETAEKDSPDGQVKLLLDALMHKDRIGHTGKLVRGLIHNINGPLHNLSMLVEMMEQGQRQFHRLGEGLPPEEREAWQKLLTKQQERLDKLSRQVSALADMLQDFMIIHEIESSDSDVDLPFVLVKLSKIFRADLFLKHQVEVVLDLQENLPPVRIPGKHVVPALMHLFENAILALRDAPHKRLTIRCRRQDNWIRVSICDTGIGLDRSLPRHTYFKLFYSNWAEASDGTKDHDMPQGFGLYAVRRLMDPYGVKLDLRWEADETRAILDFPV